MLRCGRNTESLSFPNGVYAPVYAQNAFAVENKLDEVIAARLLERCGGVRAMPAELVDFKTGP